jgi:hypothetical protein
MLVVVVYRMCIHNVQQVHTSNDKLQKFDLPGAVYVSQQMIAPC